MPTARHRLALLVALALPVGSLRAQGRTIDWPRIAVEARLDAEGRLHVRERQVIRFTGDWNGGERRFDLQHGQRFEFLGAFHVDSGSATPVAMQRGDSDRINGYDLVNGLTLRWRARQPSDPPFDRTEREYLFEYQYENVLQPPRSGDSLYHLAHDFAFGDRPGDIARFTLSLEVDEAWRTPPGFTGRFEAGPLPPGEGYVVTVPLPRLAAARPAAVDFGADPRLRQGLALVLLLAIPPLLLRLVRREQALGRFVPSPPADTVDEAWLARHVLSLPPEVVGHAWDDRTGEAEVAATLARLVQQGMLTSTVHRRGRGLFARDVLELRLNTPRAQLTGHARTLVDALFVAGDVTDTDRVRKHYKSTGFDPAALIRAPLVALVETTVGAGSTLPRPARTVSFLLFISGVATLVAGIVRRPPDVVIAIPGMAGLLVTYFVALIAAAVWQRRVRALGIGALFWAIPIAAALGALAWLLIVAPVRVGAVTLVGLTLLCLSFLHSVFNMAMTRQSAERIALRKRLVAAREFFRAELRKPDPALRDEWFAYLIAFGLGRHIDRWFRAFGGDVVRTSGAISSMGSGGGSGSTGSSSWTGFSGGGGFAGAGSSASFAAAVGGIASSVAAPSSSGSSGGGGGGGGGSSGGGGGGGW